MGFDFVWSLSSSSTPDYSRLRVCSRSKFCRAVRQQVLQFSLAVHTTRLLCTVKPVNHSSPRFVVTYPGNNCQTPFSSSFL